MTDYPRTIDNGAGERLTFLGIRSDGEGEKLEIRNEVAPGSGPPMHVHYIQEEVITVESGTMGWVREGEAEQIAHAGETARFAPGESHRFWNAGDEQLVATGYASPPDNLDYFLTKVYESMQANGGKRPRLFDAAFLLTRYRSEFGMSDPPAPVQRILFPVVVAVGGLFGLRKRFADAREPVSRS
jgi:mannose-6-phosphate isomerase-like protein (cupin superfamily)